MEIGDGSTTYDRIETRANSIQEHGYQTVCWVQRSGSRFG